MSTEEHVIEFEYNNTYYEANVIVTSAYTDKDDTGHCWNEVSYYVESLTYFDEITRNETIVEMRDKVNDAVIVEFGSNIHSENVYGIIFHKLVD